MCITRFSEFVAFLSGSGEINKLRYKLVLWFTKSIKKYASNAGNAPPIAQPMPSNRTKKAAIMKF
jgi:hypothetical protein